MLSFLFGFVFVLMLRILFGHLSAKFTIFSGWLTWLNIIVIVFAVFLAAALILNMIRVVYKFRQRTGSARSEETERKRDKVQLHRERENLRQEKADNKLRRRAEKERRKAAKQKKARRK